MSVAVAVDHSSSVRAKVQARSRSLPGGLLVVVMFVVVALVAGFAYWDEERESRAALDDLGREQAAFAAGVGLSLRSQLRVISKRVTELAQASNDERSTDVFREPDFTLYVHHEPTPSEARSADSTALWVTVPWDGHRWLEVGLDRDRILSSLGSLEQGGRLRIFVQHPQQPGLTATRDGTLFLPPLERALASGASSVRLFGRDASLLGLPARTAVAGLASLDAAKLGAWRLAVVSSAQEERDRQIHAKWRLMLAVLVAAGLVIGFGGLAWRKQREELELSQELALASAVHARDERLLQADKLATLGALATGIAHEVSTPLGVILGRAEQLSAKLSADERAKRAVETIAFQTERISAVIRGFLSVARGDVGRLERVEPDRLLRSSIDLVEHRFKSAGVQLTTDIAEPLPKIACEPHLISHVLVNLLLNARESCQPGGHVDVAVRSDGRRVAFVVTDDGRSMPPGAASRATGPFFSAGSRGEGLGLAIANEIVKHHQGVLAISAREPGVEARGTRAVVELPVPEA